MSTKTGPKKSETFRVSDDGEKMKRKKKEKKGCKEIDKWSGVLLVGAFLDLSVTYLLLCASAVSFVASKFLSLFGSSLPCPCNGLFGDPRRVGNCWQRKLVCRPAEKLSSVRVRVRSRPPFDSILDKSGALLGRDEKLRFIVRKKGVRFSPRRRGVDGKFPAASLDGSVGTGELVGFVEGPNPSGEVVGLTREVCDLPVRFLGHGNCRNKALAECFFRRPSEQLTQILLQWLDSPQGRGLAYGSFEERKFYLHREKR